MTKIYTRTGDDGSTGLLGAERVQKDSLRIEAFGALDECNAALGLARSDVPEEDLDKILESVQSLLFSAGADLACATGSAKVERVQAEDISQLEASIDKLENELTPLRAFILPGGTTAAAHIHLARAICRRAERNIVRLSRSESINPLALIAVKLGNAKRRIFYGPGINNFDLALKKGLRFSDARSLEFRVEACNAFNHAQFYGPASVDGQIENPNFGAIVSAAAPRLMQLAGKYIF